jgi:glycosyltransferase involved in cell wall biosynthesis
LHQSVRLAGRVAPSDFFSQVDVVVQLSRWENCSYTLLDALAWGKGIVATAVGGNSEMLPHRCLVPVDNRESAAECMRAQAEDPAQTPQLPERWPTVEEMAIRIGAVYDTAAATQLEWSPAS